MLGVAVAPLAKGDGRVQLIGPVPAQVVPALGVTETKVNPAGASVSVSVTVFAGDGPLFDEIRADVQARGLSGHIHLLGLRRDIANVLAGFDLFVLPTHQEALGTSFIEAMASGLPVIGTAVDGVPEVIDDGINGLLVPAHDDRALAAALLRLVDAPDERRRMGAAGMRITQTRFSVDTVASEMAAFYRNSLSERGVA